MEQLRTLGLIDGDGKPIANHIDRVLTRLVAKLRRQFPALQDDVAVIDVMEEAGRKLARIEEDAGPIERLHGYAWTTVRTVAISRMRRGSLRLIQKTLDSHVSAALLAATPAAFGSAEQIERDILMREVRAQAVRRGVGPVLVEGERTLQPRNRAVSRSLCLRRRYPVLTNQAKASHECWVDPPDVKLGRSTPCTGQRLGLRVPGDDDSGQAMAQPGQFSDDDRKARDELDEVLSRANPNPERKGCPPRQTLVELAARARAVGDPAYRASLELLRRATASSGRCRTIRRSEPPLLSPPPGCD